MAMQRTLAGLAIACAALGVSACGSNSVPGAQMAAGQGIDQIASPVAATVSDKTYDLDDQVTMNSITNCEVDYVKSNPTDDDRLYNSVRTCMKPYIGATFTWHATVADIEGASDVAGMATQFSFGWPGTDQLLKVFCPATATFCSGPLRYDTLAGSGKVTVLDIDNVKSIPTVVATSITK